MISDIPKKIAQMKELIRVIDRPVDQVLIEARVVIATDTFARDLGAKFGISGATGKPGDRSSLGFGGDVDASSANAVRPPGSGADRRAADADALADEQPAGGFDHPAQRAGAVASSTPATCSTSSCRRCRKKAAAK